MYIRLTLGWDSDSLLRLEKYETGGTAIAGAPQRKMDATYARGATLFFGSEQLKHPVLDNRPAI